MPSQLKVISVFVASPGDVAKERECLHKVADRLNGQFAEHLGVPITDPADFFGREREINFCLARLRGMQSVSITGERRISKSSLLHYLTATARARLGPEYRSACWSHCPT